MRPLFFWKAEIMRNLIMVLVLMVTFVGADVVSGTLHRSAANDDMMEAVGVYDDRVKIVRYNGVYTYAVEFPNQYFDANSDSDIERITAVFLAVGLVSAGTSWHSDFAVALFEDETIVMFTQDCRTVVRMTNNGYSDSLIGNFLGDNIATGNRSECAYVFNF